MLMIECCETRWRRRSIAWILAAGMVAAALLSLCPVDVSAQVSGAVSGGTSGEASGGGGTSGGMGLPVVSLGGEGAVRDGRVEAQLIGKTGALRRGGESVVGIRLTMDPHWHTYWRNPGDSGIPTTVGWAAPEGVVVHEIDWPAPEYLEVGGLASYGYEGQIVLPVRVEVPADFEGERVTLEAAVDWLVCREACEPGEAELRLTLPVVDGEAEAEVDERWAELFAWAEARQPRGDMPNREISVALRDGAYRVVVTDAGIPSIDASKDAEARFFPDDPMVIAMAADQPLEPTDYAGFVLTLEPHPLTGADAERLTGVVTYRNGDLFRVYRIDEPIRGVADGDRVP